MANSETEKFMKVQLKSNQGIAMVVVLAMMVILLSITGAALLLSGLHLKTASNLKTGGGAIHIADLGIQHGLALIPKGLDFDQLLTLTPAISGYSCVNSSGTSGPCNGVVYKPTVTGTVSGYTYTVVVENDTTVSGETATDDTNKIVILTSTATGSNSSKRKIRAYVGRSTVASWTPPGAIYYPGTSSSNQVFDPSGTSWTVTGSDTNYDNTAGSQAALPGIAATTSGVVTNIQNTLNTDAKRQRVQGAGYVAGPPTTASVQTTTRVEDVNAVGQAFINQITAITCPPKCTSGLQWDATSCPSSNPCTLGNDGAPQITYLKGTDNRLDGYVNGSGVLVVEGEIRLQGNFNFHGLVINIQATGSSVETKFKMIGSSKIYGGVLLGPNNNNLEFEIENSAAIRYSSTAINMVNQNWGSCCTPKSAKIIGWHEVMQ